MPIISTPQELTYTSALVVAILVLRRVERRLSGTEGRRAIESLTFRFLRVSLGEQFSERLFREGTVGLKDFWVALRNNVHTTPIPLGLRVRAVLLLLAMSYIAAGGDVLRPEAGLILFITQALRPMEWSASFGHRLDESNLWRVKFMAVGATTLGVWSLSELAVSTPDDRLFWMGWLAHALVLGRVACMGGPGNGSRRFSVAGWFLIGVGQFGSFHLPGPAGITFAVLTCLAAFYAAWGAYMEQFDANA